MNQLLNEVFSIPTPIRAAYVRNFRRFLERKAVLLIHAAEKLSDDKKKPLTSSSLKRLKTEILRMQSDTDFSLLLAIADRLSPGIALSIYGTIQEDLEKRFNDLWGLS